MYIMNNSYEFHYDAIEYQRILFDFKFDTVGPLYARNIIFDLKLFK